MKVNLFEENYGLVALQGPKSEGVLQNYVKEADLSKIPFMGRFHTEIMDHPVVVTRCGYTGEDGFEISAGPDAIVEICESLVQHKDVELAGLGARDSLRIEAGLCLHGHDISPSRTPF